MLWVGVGALGELAAYFEALPGSTLLLPATVPVSLWFGSPSHVVVVALIAGVVHAAVLALLLRIVVRRPEVVPIWFCVLAAGFVATGVLTAGTLLGASFAPGLRAFANQTIAGLAPGGLWGLVWGWLPALVGARLGRRTAPAGARGRFVGPVVAVLAAGAAALLVLPSLGRQGATPVAAPVPSPVVTHYGWARIAPPTPAPQPADACTAADVQVTADRGDAATGHRALGIHLTNTSGSACVLDGYADAVFDDAEGDAMDVLVTRGGSFMTQDPGARRVPLRPGASAVAELGWNAQSAAGEQRAGTLFVSVFPGAARQPIPVDLDIKDGGAVALTAWHAAAPA